VPQLKVGRSRAEGERKKLAFKPAKKLVTKLV
jgi:hypothetical protein